MSDPLISNLLGYEIAERRIRVRFRDGVFDVSDKYFVSINLAYLTLMLTGFALSLIVIF